VLELLQLLDVELLLDQHQLLQLRLISVTCRTAPPV
jgi:hypothetical protein